MVPPETPGTESAAPMSRPEPTARGMGRGERGRGVGGGHAEPLPRAGRRGPIGYTPRMNGPERRREVRHPVDLPGVLHLAGGRTVEVRIQNLGRMGALVRVPDLEQPVREGDRAVLEHPLIDDRSQQRASRCAVVRVELDFEEEGVTRALAVYFDGGAAPERLQLRSGSYRPT